MRAGRLRSLIELQRSTETLVAGEVVPTWHTFAEVYAAVEPLAGRQWFAALQVQAQVSHSIRIRWSPDWALGPKDRIKFGTRVFDIVSVLNIQERNRELVVQALENLR